MKKSKFLKKNTSFLLLLILKNLKKYSLKYRSLRKTPFTLAIYHNYFFTLPKNFSPLKFNKFKDLAVLNYLKKKFKLKQLYTNTLLKFNTLKSLSLYDLYTKFISFVFRVGKKAVWEKSFSQILNTLSLKLYYSKSLLLSKIFVRLFTRVELKKVKSRKRISFIPFFITVRRSIFLSLKWIFLSSLNNNTNTSFKNKLYLELFQLLTLKSCPSLKKLEENNQNSFKNRSNIHYRWNTFRLCL